MSFNQWIGFGNLTADPELRYTQSGKAICSFKVACNRRFKGQDGNFKEAATFVDVRAWEKSGETVAKCFKKGQEIFISGRLVNDSWTDKQSGQKRSKIVVECEQWSFVGPKQSQQAAHSTPPPAQATSPATASQQQPPPEEDSVPF